MSLFLGRLLKYFLWVLFFSILGSFVYGLYTFKRNFSEYVTYLNQISIFEVFTVSKDFDILSDDILNDDELFNQEFSGLLNDEDYFLPDDESIDDDSELYGFSGANIQNGTNQKNDSDTKTDLINLIKSHEQ